ncbi:MAG: tetratricopeptide repeat protein [Verrucomicrobiae bacterium]|nr:tetratricopeptide repeat protein [Verrucomicrobiae bacterium]
MKRKHIPTGRITSRPRIAPTGLALLPAALLLAVLMLTGCASVPPPAPMSPVRQQARQSLANAQAAYDRGNWVVAAQLFERAAVAFAALDDLPALADARHNQARSLQHAGRHQSAIAAYREAAQLNEKLNRPRERARNLTGLAQCHRALGQLESALATLESARALAGRDPLLLATLDNDHALVLLDRGDSADRDEIIRRLQNARALYAQQQNRPALARCILNLGRAYMAFAEWPAALPELNAALAAFRELDDIRGLAQAHELLASWYAHNNNQERAEYHHRQALDKYAFLKDEAALRRLQE